MIRSFSARTLAFDCEWVPCAETAKRLLNLPAECSEGEAFKAVWDKYKPSDVDDSEQAGSRPFLKLALCKVISIAAIVRVRQPDGAIKLGLYSRGIDECTESELLGTFLEKVAAIPKVDSGTPSERWQLWGYNSSGSDIPVLTQRAIALGVPCPGFAKRGQKFGDWDYYDDRRMEAHVDILNLIANYARGGAPRPSMHEFAAACGVPGKLDVSGGDVADLYLANKIAEIRAYNELDALTTHLMMLKVALHSGNLPQPTYHAETQAVEQFIDQQIQSGKMAMAQFKERWMQIRTDR